MTRPFRPPIGLRDPRVQSVLATLKARRLVLRAPRGTDPPRETIVETPAGVRLLALHETPPRSTPSRGVAILLHGWEGSARSTYLESLRPGLLADGWELYRLNLRDHGDTQHLNRDLFHSCRIAEVVDAVAELGARRPGSAPVLIGFSLGGNFALRVALRAPDRGIALRGVIAVNPVLDPASCLDALERGPRLFERHFVAKWRRSIRKKQAAFPDLHDFSSWFELDGLRAQTRYLIERMTEYPTLEAYLDGYSIARDRLRPLRVPARLISTRDDPIIPARDLATLDASTALTVEVHDRGGHCGFVETPWLRTWIDDRIRDLLRREPPGGPALPDR